MSHTRRDNNMPHNNIGNSLQKEREREKKRREQQFAKQEEVVDEPIFSQPRKVTTSRQDSLTINIKKALGDPCAVTEVLFREPNIWLGTSRSGQGPPTPAPSQPQSDAQIFTTSSQNKNAPVLSSQKAYSSNSIKRGSETSGGGGSGGGYSQSSNMNSHESHRAPTSAGSHNIYKSREDASNRSYTSQAKHQDSFNNRNRHNFSSSFNMKSGKEDASPKSANTQHSSFNSSHLPISNREAGILLLDSLDPDKAFDMPARISERDRVSSVDSDMLGGVENILKEMVDLPPSITEIKTPSVNENKFSFMKRKVIGPESSLESSAADVLDAGDASDGDSSGDESSDEGEEDDAGSWNLGSLRGQSQPSSNPLLTTDTLSMNNAQNTNKEGATLNSKNSDGDFGNKSRLDEKISSSRNRDGHFSPRGTDLQNRNQTLSRGRKDDRKQLSGQRSSSSGKRSSSSQRGTPPASQSRPPHSLNQTDPAISQSWANKNESHSKTKRHSSRQFDSSGSNRRGSGSETPRSPPHDSAQSNYRNSSLKSSRPSKAQQGQSSSNKPEEKVESSALDIDPTKTSLVSKVTISSSAPTTKERHSVGRKGPRLSGHGAYSSSKVKPATSGSPNHFSDSDMSDADNDVADDVNLNKKENDLSDSDAGSSSDSNSESSSSSDSESENEGSGLPNDDAPFENPQVQSSSPSWSLSDMRENAEQNLSVRHSPINSIVTVSRKSSQSSPPRVTSPTSTYQPNTDQHNPITVPAANDLKTKIKTQTKSNTKKSSRKSAPGLLTPNPNKSPAILHERGNNGKLSSKLHNTTWNTASKSTVENNNQKSSTVLKSRRTPGHDGGNGSPRDSKQHLIHSAVTTEHESNRVKNQYHEDKQFSRKSLLVRIRASLLNSDAKHVPLKKVNTSYKSPQGSALKRSPRVDQMNVISAMPSKFVKSPESSIQYTIPQKRTLTTVSTGSETEQPIRRANCVQVAYADSRDLTDSSTSVSKRKHETFDQNYEDDSRKRMKRDKSSSRQTSPRSAAPSPWGSNQSQHKSSPNDQWRDPSNAEFSHQQSDRDDLHNNHDEYRNNNHMPYSSSQVRQESPTSNKPSLLHQSTASSASFVLPDSSVPGEQERIQTSDWYMREGKRMKHEGDGIVDSRTGRTRPGEALNRALAYFEASLFFIMSGCVMETENREDRLESSSNSSSSSHSPNNMYQQTLPLLDFVLKMRPHVEQEDRIFKRIMVSCIRCQAFLYFRIYKLKKDVAVKYSELLTDQFKTMSKSNRTPSPWHHANAAPNVLSPMSPAVPSPFGHGPSPVSSNGEQVTSSTQAGKMTPPSHGGYSFPQKMYDIYRQHHTITCNLQQAHEKWDQVENMLEGHTDFFRNIDTLCNQTLTFHTSLRDVFLYHKMVLHQLRTLTTNSPRD